MITLEEATQRQGQLYSDGQALLEAYNIADILAPLGDVHVVGSFASQLLVKPDIDYSIYSEKPDIKKVAVACQQLLEIPELTRVKVSNRQGFTEPQVGKPRGIYLGFDIFFRETTWQFDVWVMRMEDEIKEFMGDDWQNSLTKEDRDAIIYLKHNLTELGRYPGIGKDKFASADIYRSVKNDGVRTISELEKWRESHPYH